MPKITNKSQSPLRLPRGTNIPVGGSVELEAAEWEKQKSHPVVKAWLSADSLSVEGKSKAPTKSPSKARNKGDNDGNGNNNDGDTNVSDAEQRYRALPTAELAKLINEKKPNSTNVSMTKDQLVDLALEIEA